MSVPVFLVDELPDDDHATLTGPEGHHAADVRRLRPGELVRISDGRGGVADTVVTTVGRGRLELRITARHQEPPADPRLVVVQALGKGERGELAVQAMTEVGVDEVVPWSAARSVVQWRGERGERAHQRWVATAREAAKQSRRAWLPTVTPLADTSAVVERLAAAEAGFVLHEEAADRLATAELPTTGQIVLVVGPEGGVAPAEVAAFTAAGARAVRLGPTVLRTSTAGVAALAVLNARLARW